MKKFIGMLLAAALCTTVIGCGASAEASENPVLTHPEESSVYGVEAPDSQEEITFTDGKPVRETHVLSAQTPDEIRGVWLAYVNYKDVIPGYTEAQFTQTFEKMFKNIADTGFNTVFVQVRPFGDALYPSKYFPWTRYLTGTEGENPGYDPLRILCGLADKYELRMEAWINPYRVRTDGRPLSEDNPARKWIESGNPAALKWNDGIYYNPGDKNARQLIVNGVKEIVENYDVDGIHFDDYFYPTTDMNFDADTYKQSQSKLSQADWRRENVNKLVKEVYRTIKAVDPECVFGISPQGNMENNYDGQFIDCAEWLANEGYVDYIMPQIYYGYDNVKNPYAQTVQKWNDLIKVDSVKLYVGLAGYKLGAPDAWAGDKGKNEFLNTQDLMSQMVRTAREAGNYGGIAVYSYDSLFLSPTPQVQKEVGSLKALFAES